MKVLGASQHTPLDVTTAALRSLAVPEPIPDVAGVHRVHGDFVWASLQRLGARDPELEDLFQEVFLRVHRRLGSFEGRSQLTTWLFGICVRVVAAHRRRAWVRRERPYDPIASDHDGGSPLRIVSRGDDPEQRLQSGQTMERVQTILDGMPLTHRAVFVMSVMEEMSSDEIAAQLGIPTGTVWSRLHAARKLFDAGAARWHARDLHGGLR